MSDVLRVRDLPQRYLLELLARLGLKLSLVPTGAAIPASYWGESEAGIDGQLLWARADTPLHSLLHEASHWVCATRFDRDIRNGDAGADDAEECAACYLQVLLADALPSPMSRARLFSDMDAWGYSFREGGAARWFAGDGEEARQWLVTHGFIDEQAVVLFAAQNPHNLVGLGASP